VEKVLKTETSILEAGSLPLNFQMEKVNAMSGRIQTSPGRTAWACCL